jgi:hypothetical protein
MNLVPAFAGRQGPLLLFFGVLIGFMFPTLAGTATKTLIARRSVAATTLEVSSFDRTVLWHNRCGR